MEYHSLLFEPRRCLTVNQWVIVSVSLRSIIHSYKEQVADADAELEFPSPYGVSFILIYNWLLWWLYVRWVSVSLRSYIHSYKVLKVLAIMVLSLVSVSLWSYIHSYSLPLKMSLSYFKCFHLLMELYSFLLEWRLFLHRCLWKFVSVSLRSITHSYPMAKKVFYYNIFLECYRVIFLFLKFFCYFK